MMKPGLMTKLLVPDVKVCVRKPFASVIVPPLAGATSAEAVMVAR
jgi:hypothetical protein